MLTVNMMLVLVAGTVGLAAIIQVTSTFLIVKQRTPATVQRFGK
jgi:hypothetical protein